MSGADLGFACPIGSPTCPTAPSTGRRRAHRAGASPRRGHGQAGDPSDGRRPRTDQATRFIDVLEAGYINESNTGEKRQNGYEIGIEIPLFDWGDASSRAPRRTYMQSVHRRQSATLRRAIGGARELPAYRTTTTLRGTIAMTSFRCASAWPTNRAALQRHADRRVRPHCRRARADRQHHRPIARCVSSGWPMPTSRWRCTAPRPTAMLPAPATARCRPPAQEGTEHHGTHESPHFSPAPR